MNDDDAVLGEIRRLNDDIDDPVMSQKIDRIGDHRQDLCLSEAEPQLAAGLRSF